MYLHPTNEVSISGYTAYAFVMRRVFSRPMYIFLGIFAGLVVFLTIAWLTAIPLILQIVLDETLSAKGALPIVGQLLFFSITDFTAFNATYTLAIAALVGVNVALLTFYFRMYRAAPSSTSIASGGIGAVAALLGFGCAACGSLFITALFATLGGTSVLAFLPYQGAEVGAAAVIFLLISTYLLAKGINKPPVCPM